MITIKASDLFNKPQKNKKKLAFIIVLLITGFLSAVFVFVTIYGQYTGTYLVTLTRETRGKGITLSESYDFVKKSTTLKIEPLNFTEDIIEAFDYQTIESTDGQYFEPIRKKQHYIAYTFYLRNNGNEVVDLDYMIYNHDDYKDLAMGTAVWIKRTLIKDDVLDDNPYTQYYSKAYTSKDLICTETIEMFNPGETYKFTIIIWLNGEGLGIETKPEMIGGALKLDWTFRITERG